MLRKVVGGFPTMWWVDYQPRVGFLTSCWKSNHVLGIPTTALSWTRCSSVQATQHSDSTQRMSVFIIEMFGPWKHLPRVSVFIQGLGGARNPCCMHTMWFFHFRWCPQLQDGSLDRGQTSLSLLFSQNQVNILLRLPKSPAYHCHHRYKVKEIMSSRWGQCEKRPTGPVGSRECTFHPFRGYDLNIWTGDCIASSW